MQIDAPIIPINFSFFFLDDANHEVQSIS